MYLRNPSSNPLLHSDSTPLLESSSSSVDVVGGGGGLEGFGAFLETTFAQVCRKRAKPEAVAMLDLCSKSNRRRLKGRYCGWPVKR